MRCWPGRRQISARPIRFVSTSYRSIASAEHHAAVVSAAAEESAGPNAEPPHGISCHDEGTRHRGRLHLQPGRFKLIVSRRKIRPGLCSGMLQMRPFTIALLPLMMVAGPVVQPAPAKALEVIG